jgi:hypothetical protein
MIEVSVVEWIVLYDNAENLQSSSLLMIVRK